MTKAYPLRAIALAALLSVAPVSAALAGKADNTLNVSFSEEILELDYNYTTKREYIIISDLIDDTLFSVDPATNEPRSAAKDCRAASSETPPAINALA